MGGVRRECISFIERLVSIQSGFNASERTGSGLPVTAGAHRETSERLPQTAGLPFKESEILIAVVTTFQRQGFRWARSFGGSRVLSEHV